MFLAIDVGNSQTVLGCFEGKRLLQQWRVSTYPICTPDEYQIRLSALGVGDVDSVVISSVVPRLTEVVRNLFKKKGRPIKEVTHSSPFSFRLDRVAADEVGADRLVNAEAGVRDYGTPLVILDSGTATTLCAVGPDGYFLGGAIMPGIEGSIDTLVRQAARLNAVELELPSETIGPNTRSALQSGILYGYASMVDGMVARFADEIRQKYSLENSEKIKIVATGGVSERLKTIAESITNFDSDLTLKGLAYLHETFRSR